MIFWTDEQCEIGKVVVPKAFIVDPLGNTHEPQPIFIILEATHEEWEQDVIRQGGDPTGFPPSPYYYEGSID